MLSYFPFAFSPSNRDFWSLQSSTGALGCGLRSFDRQPGAHFPFAFLVGLSPLSFERICRIVSIIHTGGAVIILRDYGQAKPRPRGVDQGRG